MRLEMQAVTSGYHYPMPAISDVSLHVEQGEIATIIGPNGAGKTTTLNTISGLIKPWTGKVTLDGRDIGHLSPPAIVRQGVSQVPEGRRILPGLTARENLAMGGYTVRRREAFNSQLDQVLSLFPDLLRLLGRLGGTLSGGEQQMLAIGRALMSLPKILLLDEPSLGLAPVIVERIVQHVVQLRTQGLGILIVEQNARLALEIADHAYVLESGRVAVAGPSESVRADPDVQRAYLTAE